MNIGPKILLSVQSTTTGERVTPTSLDELAKTLAKITGQSTAMWHKHVAANSSGTVIDKNGFEYVWSKQETIQPVF